MRTKYPHFHFHFAGKSKSGKTSMWDCYSNANDAYLGTVKWKGQWRQYAMYYEEITKMWMNSSCLRDVADFCDQVNDLRKKGMIDV